MTFRVVTGWQTLLADLAIILFMITAATLSQASDRAVAGPVAPSPRAEPLAVYREGPGAPAIGEWLAAQSVDTRQQLTILAHYGPGAQQAALDRAIALLKAAGRTGERTRIVVEPGEGGITATLAYDSPALAVAR